MTKLSVFLIAFIALSTLSFSVSAQDDVELILEEVEGGYIIINWEDTKVYDEAPEEYPAPPVVEQEESAEPAGNNDSQGKKSSSSNKGTKKTSSKSKVTKKNLRGKKL